MAVIGFSKNWPKEIDFNQAETFFQEKILRGFIDLLEIDVKEYIDKNEDLNIRTLETCSPKIHTLRKKGKAKRKKGMIMHPSTSVRQKDQMQFAPEVTIVSVIPVKFIWSPIINARTTLTLSIDGKEFHAADTVGGIVTYSSPLCNKLAQNDGFNSVKTFLKYFSENGTYELLSWTGYEYEVPEE